MQALPGRLWLTLILYVAAIIIMMYCDCQADRYIPKSQVSTWGHLKSWIKRLAQWRLFLMVAQWTLMLVRLVSGTLSGLFRWLFPDPDPEWQQALRRQRNLHAAVLAWHPSPPPSRRLV